MGRWVSTDDVGWVWAADEPWGWATYHYGRWDDDPTWSQVWVPGDVWGPAWVDWRDDDEVVGWAPLAPDLMVTEDRIEVPEWSRWTFVVKARFTDRDVGRFAAPLGRDQTLIQRTRFVGTVREVGGRVEDKFVDRTTIETATGRRSESVRLTGTSDLGGTGLRGTQLAVFRSGLSRDGVRPDPVDRSRLASDFVDDRVALEQVQQDRLADMDQQHDEALRRLNERSKQMGEDSFRGKMEDRLDQHADAMREMEGFHEHERFAMRCRHGFCA